MTRAPDGNAIVYCEGAYNTTNGKTAHGLVRFTKRYRVLSVVDSRYGGEDAGQILDGRPNGIPMMQSTEEALSHARENGSPATHFVIGIAPDGGRLSTKTKEEVKRALRMGLNIDSGSHDFLSEESEFASLAAERGVKIRDIRRPPPVKELHFFTSKIEEVRSLKVALLGTDSAVGKRTTAWILVNALNDAGYHTELIGTGQTAWMQGVEYGVIMDSLINDFVSGEIEHAVWSAWNEKKPGIIVIEGQGSIMNPAYPGGFEILAAGRPDVIILQHPPRRIEYDGFPGYKLHPLDVQIKALELLSGKPVIAVTINHEDMNMDEIQMECDRITETTGRPAYDVLVHGAQALVEELLRYI